jgi:iron complex outermembrane receptor protein
MRRATACAALAAALTLGEGLLRPADAQDGFKQTVVVTAAASPVELGTVNRTLSVITSEQIAALPVRSVADVLRLITSVDVRARGERGVQTDFSIRGASFGQTLVLVDGVRLNDAQSGHHNGDVPVPLDAIDRIEVLHGTGSSLFGADAFGGTINIITKREAPAGASIEAGSFDLVSGRGQASFGRGSVRQLVSASAQRSSGFMYERQFDTVDLLAQTSYGQKSSVAVSYLWNDFGANGFYGNAPSHEWTNQTRLALTHAFASRAGWDITAIASYRTHGDRFLFNVERPGVAENFHRSHAVIGTVKGTHSLPNGGSLSLGAEGGGDWIRSTNLGDHEVGRVSAFGEWRQTLNPRAHVDASVRFDQYGEFGASVSPSAGVGWWLAPRVRLRASGGRAFRVPTFTERFYSDPANLASPDIGPETTWGGEGGADIFLNDAWLAQVTLFGRSDHEVIDWLRATPTDRWRTYNVHHVRTIGTELQVRRMLAGGAFIQGGYTSLDLNADTISDLCGAPTCLSKYVLEYAPHAFSATAFVPLPGGIHVAPRLEYKHRQRNAATTDDAILDVRVSRRFGRYNLQVEGTNLANVAYQEVAGVAMPGRAATVTLGVR